MLSAELDQTERVRPVLASSLAQPGLTRRWFRSACAAAASWVALGCGTSGAQPGLTGDEPGFAASGGIATAAGSGGTAGTANGTSGASATAGADAITGDRDELAEADVGTKAMHRMSNSEYDNTVRDLLHSTLRFGDSFVVEEAEGFDNIAAALSMSPRHVEEYFTAARALAEDVFASPELRSRIVQCELSASDGTCAESTITSFGKQAFRRPIEPSELEWLMNAYQEALALGESPDGAMQHVVHIVLASPQFLYRIEFDPNPTDVTPHALSAWELASRLSYALWSSMPDETLFDLAARNELHDPEVLSAQVDRMLDDSRAEALAANFVGHWLGAKRLEEHTARPDIYPDWSVELGESMRKEMELYFLEFLRGERPYSEFLSADINFTDARLAEYYGMPPQGDAFQRVESTTDRRRGLIGLAGFLTHTSRETRSSPIVRGKWILDAMWCVELKVPAGVVVQPLPESELEAQNATVRELMEAHRADAACAPCHNLIDPIGLSLEHFDGIGRYRETYEGGGAIDSTTELPGGNVVDSLETLSDALASDAKFVPCIAKKFNTYALGRTETALPFLEDIVARWTAQNVSLRNMIKATVTSDTFTMRRASTP